MIRKNARPLWAGRSLYSAFTRNCRAVCRLSRSELPKEALLRKDVSSEDMEICVQVLEKMSENLLGSEREKRKGDIEA